MALTPARHMTDKETWEHRFVETREWIEHACRQASRAEYLGNGSTLCRVLDRFLMNIPTRDLAIAPHLMMGGIWESWVTRAIARHLKPGMTCVDVGANFGYYTLLMASFCGPENVIAIEPIFEPWLGPTLRLNGYEDVTIHKCALSDDRGPRQQTFYVPTRYMSSATLHPSLIGDKDTHSAVTVDVSSLDALMRANPVVINGEAEGLRMVDFVKIDAEGSEPQIWRGMRETWAGNPEMVCCLEFDRDFYPEPWAVLNEFAKTALLRFITTRGELSSRHLSTPEDETKAVIDEVLSFKGSTMLWLTHKDD